jgi:hypothetical protein
VGPPIDLLVYSAGELDVTRRRRFIENDPDLMKIRTRWQQALRQAVARLPNIRLKATIDGGAENGSKDESIQLVVGEAGMGAGEVSPPQMAQNSAARDVAKKEFELTNPTPQGSAWGRSLR